jgi:hypothetical protein
MRPDELRLRQQVLLIRSTELRHTLHKDLQRLQRPAAWADQLKAGLTWLYQHPQWPAAGLALLLILKPSRFVVWTGRLWWLWKSAQQLRRLRDALVLRLARA